MEVKFYETVDDALIKFDRLIRYPSVSANISSSLHLFSSPDSFFNIILLKNEKEKFDKGLFEPYNSYNRPKFDFWRNTYANRSVSICSIR